jgi:hypothetical protein
MTTDGVYTATSKPSTNNESIVATKWHNLHKKAQLTGVNCAFSILGGAVGELPPESEVPGPRFLQAQFRFYLRQAHFSKPEWRLQQLLNFGRIAERVPHPSRSSWRRAD